MSTYFKNEANLLLEEIDLLLSGFGGLGNKSFEYFLENKVRKSTADQLKKATEKDLREMKSDLEILPVMNMTVAFEPTLSQQKAIAEYLPDCIFDLKIDPKIIAGLVISYQGKYKDFSFKSAYEQISTLS